MAKRGAPEEVDDEAETGEIRRAVKRLHTGDEPRYGDAAFGADPAAWAQRLFAGAHPSAAPAGEHHAGGASGPHGMPHAPPDKGTPWKARCTESQNTPESPTRPPLPNEDSEEGPDAAEPDVVDERGGEYSEMNLLLRSLHFERLMRLQSRSPQPQAVGPAAAQQARAAAAPEPPMSAG